jgi:hypothetical protein
VERCPRPSWIENTCSKTSQKAGRRFEAQQQERFLEKYGEDFEPEPWFRFVDGERTWHCCPDGILWLDKGPIIVEFKLSHTYHAWRQLKKLYLPVVKAAHPDVYFRLLEVCKNFDPSVNTGSLSIEFILFPENTPWRGLGIIVDNLQLGGG